MNIIAIDPGNEQSALLCWDGSKIRYGEIIANDSLLGHMRAIQEPGQELAIEMVACYGMPVGKSIFDTVFWIGRFWQRWLEEAGGGARLVYRSQIKMHHCNSMRAKDSNIRAVLIDKYGAPGTKKAPGLTYGLKADLWSAFAIATFVTETEKTIVKIDQKI